MSRLITEREVQQLAAGARLVLERGTLVTPAARDLAHARGIELVIGDAPAARGEKSCCAAHGESNAGSSGESNVESRGGPWPKLADGDWLVEVRDGKVRARRIER